MAQKAKAEKTNMVFLAGSIFNLWVRDGSGMVLVNVGDEKRSVPANLFGKEDQPLIDKLSLFDKGDFIALKGYLRPWAQKVDDKWKNNLEFHVTEISTDPPEGRRQQTTSRSGWQGASDDDVTEISTDPPEGRRQQTTSRSGWQGASDDDIPF